MSTEVTDLKGEARFLTEQLGKLRGQLAAADERLSIERGSFERLLDEKDQRTTTIAAVLEEAQRLVRQYVPEGTDLAQMLIDERKAEAD